MRRLLHSAFFCLGALALLVSTGCELRQKMYDQPKFESYEESEFFSNKSSARIPPEGTVAQGHLNEDEAFYTGKKDGAFLKDLPEGLELTKEFLDRGQERFQIHCAVCHGYSGKGDGFVVQRGYKQPTSYHAPRLRESDLGYFFQVMTQGYGVMASYSYQVKPEDRWAIAAYIRTLQVSHHAPIDLVQSTHEEREAH